MRKYAAVLSCFSLLLAGSIQAAPRMKPMYPQGQGRPQFNNAQQPGTAVTIEQYHLINSMSYDELCSAYVEQHMLDTGAPAWWSELMAYKDNRAKFKKCAIAKTKQRFTHDELKEMFIQPHSMDKTKYDRKIAALYHEQMPQCVHILSKVK